MRKTLSYIVLGITAVVGLYSVYQINGVTSVIAQYNKESLEADWESPTYYNDGPVDPEPADYYGEPTTTE